jgi:holo-[acyl-carrier protein] synthase
VIVGLGVELVDTARFEAALDRFGERLRDRLFTANERVASARTGTRRTTRGVQGLAVRFAAKLATRHALNAPSLAWRDIEVIRAEQGPPELLLHGGADEAARSVGVGSIALTLTHDSKWCIGQVILEVGD